MEMELLIIRNFSVEYTTEKGFQVDAHVMELLSKCPRALSQISQSEHSLEALTWKLVMFKYVRLIIKHLKAF